MLESIDFLIITPLQEECDAFLGKLTNAEQLTATEEDILVYWRATIDGMLPGGQSIIYSIIVLPLLQMGRSNAALATADAIRRWEPRVVMLCGIAGGLSKNGIQLGDVLIANQIVDYEERKRTPDDEEIRWQMYWSDDRLLLAAANLKASEWHPLVTAKRPNQRSPQVHTGPICTGDKVITAESWRQFQQDVRSRLIGVEMEASGVMQAPYQAALGQAPMFMVCGVSDLADPKKEPRQRQVWRSYACDVAAAFTVGLIRSGPIPMRSASDNFLLTRVALCNYRSIAACDLNLGPLSIFVGPNGSGKSNFFDALRFVSEALRYSLDHALRNRGGIHEIRRRSSGHPTHFTIRLEFRLPSGHSGYYAFQVGVKQHGAYRIQQEECFAAHQAMFYKIADGKLIEANFSTVPVIPKDRLYLVNVSGLDAFRPVYDALSNMGFYNLNPDRIRELQPPDPGELLSRDGSNLASVLGNLEKRFPETKKRIEEYLAKVTPGVVSVEPQTIGPKETLEFRQEVRGAKHAWRFLAANMSDGTLRALGVLVALFHEPMLGRRAYRLVGIEEPELALHPAAAGVLTDSLRDASTHRQVLITSHSPELLDDPAISGDTLFAVTSEHGETKIGRLDPAGRSALRDHLYTAGELLRMDQLRPDPAETNIQLNRHRLFGMGETLAARRSDC